MQLEKGTLQTPGKVAVLEKAPSIKCLKPVGVLNHLSQETETGGNLGNLTKPPASINDVPREQYVLKG